MTFVQVECLVFVTGVLTLHRAVWSRVAQKVLLVIASAVFYGWVHPWWLVRRHLAALLDFGAGPAPPRRW